MTAPVAVGKLGSLYSSILADVMFQKNMNLSYITAQLVPLSMKKWWFIFPKKSKKKKIVKFLKILNLNIWNFVRKSYFITSFYHFIYWFISFTVHNRGTKSAYN